MSERNPPVILVGGPGDFVQLFLDVYPGAHGRIRRWVMADPDRVPHGKNGYPLEYFPSAFPADDSDNALVDRVLRRHWLDLTLVALRGTEANGLELRALVTGLILSAVRFVRQAKELGAELVFVGVPHRIEMFALFATAYESGIPYVVSFQSTLEHLGALLPRPFPFEPLDEAPVYEHEGPLSEMGQTLLRKLRGQYKEAVQPSMSVQFTERTALGLISRKLKKRSLPTVFGVKTFAQRTMLQRAYEERAVTTWREPFIYVPLHYQPERTTMPQGRIYADQELMVRRIAKATPAGLSILVREHPSTFLIGGPVWRTTEAYDRFAAIPRVTLVSADVNPFALVDAATCVCTVCGTVALEAAARGKPTMVFGAAAYIGMPGSFDVGDREPQLLASPAEGAFERWLSSFEKCRYSVATKSAPLVNDRRDWSYHSCGMLAALFPERVDIRENARWVSPP